MPVASDPLAPALASCVTLESYLTPCLSLCHHLQGAEVLSLEVSEELKYDINNLLLFPSFS